MTKNKDPILQELGAMFKTCEVCLSQHSDDKTCPVCDPAIESKQERFEKFTARWQQEHLGKYPSALEYFNAIWELAELQTSEFWINAMKEIVTADTLGRLAERVEAKIEDKTK